MDNFLVKVMHRMKNEIRKSAVKLHEKGYDVKLKIENVSEVKCLSVYINGKYVCCSCVVGLYQNIFNIRNSMSVIERFVMEVA